MRYTDKYNTDIVATIDQLNQYLEGNIPTEAMIEDLEDLVDKLKKRYIDELTERAIQDFGTSA